MRMWVVVVAAFFFTLFGFIPGLGLPGALMLVVGGLLLLPLWALWPALNMGEWPSHAGWGAAIMLELTWFPFLIIAYVFVFRVLREKPPYTRWYAWLSIFVAWSIVGYIVMAYMATNGL